jgi:hypothetical protein
MLVVVEGIGFRGIMDGRSLRLGFRAKREVVAKTVETIDKVALFAKVRDELLATGVEALPQTNIGYRERVGVALDRIESVTVCDAAGPLLLNRKLSQVLQSMGGACWLRLRQMSLRRWWFEFLGGVADERGGCRAVRVRTRC